MEKTVKSMLSKVKSLVVHLQLDPLVPSHRSPPTSMGRASKGTPSSNPAQDRSLCQPRCWQQYHPTRDVVESLPQPPTSLFQAVGFILQVLAIWGWDPLCSIPWGAGGGRMGLCCPRRDQRHQERLEKAGTTARVCPKEPQEGKGVKAGKSWGEILEGESRVREPRPELSRPGKLCCLCSHGNRSDALQLGCFSVYF